MRALVICLLSITIISHQLDASEDSIELKEYNQEQNPNTIQTKEELDKFIKKNLNENQKINFGYLVKHIDPRLVAQHNKKYLLNSREQAISCKAWGLIKKTDPDSFEKAVKNMVCQTTVDSMGIEESTKCPQVDTAVILKATLVAVAQELKEAENLKKENEQLQEQLSLLKKKYDNDTSDEQCGCLSWWPCNRLSCDCCH